MITIDDLIIRTIENKDLNLIMKWQNQNFRGDFQEFNFISRVAIEKEYMDNGFCGDKNQILIFQKDENYYIGLVYINFIRTGLVRVGLVIDEEYRNSGYGSKIANVIVNYIFENYPIHRIEAETDCDNVGAQKVLEKSGFEKEGILRNYRYHHGKY